MMGIGLPPSLLAHATWVGALIGAAYALSPATIWFATATALILWWAARGLPTPERRWVLGLLVAAVAVRLLMLVALFVTADHDRHQVSAFPFEGDGLYFVWRSLWIRNMWTGTPVDPHVYGVAISSDYGWSSYLYVLAYVHYLIGPAPFGVRLLNVWLFVAAAVLLHKVVRPSFGPIAACGGLAVVLLLPSLVAWSVTALKESLQFALAAVSVTSAVAAIRTTGWWRRALALACCATALMAIGTVRTGALFTGTVALSAAMALTIAARRPVTAAATAVLLAAIGIFAIGPQQAQTAVMERLKESANRHIGNVRTEGHAYKLLDERFYAGDRLASMTRSEAARYVTRALVSFVMLPLPWTITSKSELAYLFEQVVWWVLLVCAVLGVVAGLRRDVLLTFTLAAYAAVGAGVIAINSGNIGSMIRHRDTVIPFMVWLSALGALEVFRLVAAPAVPAIRDDRRKVMDAACA